MASLLRKRALFDTLTVLPEDTHLAEASSPKMYKSRFRRWGLWKHHMSNNIAERAHRPIALICRTPTPEPGDSPELQNEERMYRALRDYYDASFSARRWAFDGVNTPERDSPSHKLAIQQTRKANNDCQETWWRFRAALSILERHVHSTAAGNNPITKDGDFAQGVLLIRIAFAELSALLSAVESPELFPSLLYVMILLNESPLLDFRPVEIQLLKHLHDLTSLSSNAPSTSRHVHPTATLWRTLWSHGRGLPRTRHALSQCNRIAVAALTAYIGPLHPCTINLTNFSIFSLSRNGTGDPEDKSLRFRRLLSQLETETSPVYDARHVDVICCWASHLRHHGCAQNDLAILHQGIALLEGVLTDPDKSKAVEGHIGGAFNMCSLLTSMYDKLQRWDVAEGWMRRGIGYAERERAETGEDGDLLEGYIGLEVVLRAQGKVEEAEGVREERRMVVRGRLEGVGEREDSVEL